MISSPIATGVALTAFPLAYEGAHSAAENYDEKHGTDISPWIDTGFLATGIPLFGRAK